MNVIYYLHGSHVKSFDSNNIIIRYYGCNWLKNIGSLASHCQGPTLHDFANMSHILSDFGYGHSTATARCTSKILSIQNQNSKSKKER